MQMKVLDSIFGRICHPFLKYEQNTYTYVQHGSLMDRVDGGCHAALGAAFGDCTVAADPVGVVVDDDEAAGEEEFVKVVERLPRRLVRVAVEPDRGESAKGGPAGRGQSVPEPALDDGIAQRAQGGKAVEHAARGVVEEDGNCVRAYVGGVGGEGPRVDGGPPSTGGSWWHEHLKHVLCLNKSTC